jgi:hypothetical protein
LAWFSVLSSSLEYLIWFRSVLITCCRCSIDLLIYIFVVTSKEKSTVLEFPFHTTYCWWVREWMMFGVHSGWELIKAIQICRLVWPKIGQVASYQMWFGQRYQLIFHAPKDVQLAASETLMCTILAFGFWLTVVWTVLPPSLKIK